jgi:hypothetical protein
LMRTVQSWAGKSPKREGLCTNGAVSGCFEADCDVAESSIQRCWTIGVRSGIRGQAPICVT